MASPPGKRDSCIVALILILTAFTAITAGGAYIITGWF